MRMPTRCTLVAFAEPFQSNASTLLLFTVASGQRVFRCLRETSSSNCVWVLVVWLIFVAGEVLPGEVQHFLGETARGVALLSPGTVIRCGSDL
jgi:hypothetical protein